jgi:hypothetical protein
LLWKHGKGLNVPASARRNWEEKTAVEGRPGGEFAEETGVDFAVSRDLPDLFDEEDDETTVGARALVHSIPKVFLRAIASRSHRPPSSHAAEDLPSLAVPADADTEDGSDRQVTHSVVRRNVPASPRRAARAATSVPRWVWLASPPVLVGVVAAIVAAFATR